MLSDAQAAKEEAEAQLGSLRAAAEGAEARVEALEGELSERRVASEAAAAEAQRFRGQAAMLAERLRGLEGSAAGADDAAR